MAGLLQGHIAAVTGGGSGIGQGICQAYAREGARVIVLDANLEGANETVGLVTKAGGQASAVKVDVTDRQACKAAAAEIAKGGNVSILVNNAGINRRNPITGDAAAVTKDWDDILSINLDGVFNITHAFLDQIRATKGRIVNIGSIQSFVHVSWPNSAAYTTSKHGVLGFTRALAAELGKDGVRVNAIGPGLIETRINAEALFLEYQEESGEVLTPEIFPRADGTVWACAISSTARLPQDPAHVAADDGAHARLEALCRSLAPALAQAPIVARQACFRPVTEDGLPLIGRVSGVDGLYVATGHSVWGMLNAPATGEAMAELILDGAACHVDLAPFAPGRLR